MLIPRAGLLKLFVQPGGLPLGGQETIEHRLHQAAAHGVELAGQSIEPASRRLGGPLRLGLTARVKRGGALAHGILDLMRRVRSCGLGDGSCERWRLIGGLVADPVEQLSQAGSVFGQQALPVGRGTGAVAGRLVRAGSEGLLERPLIRGEPACLVTGPGHLVGQVLRLQGANLARQAFELVGGGPGLARGLRLVPLADLIGRLANGFGRIAETAASPIREALVLLRQVAGGVPPP